MPFGIKPMNDDRLWWGARAIFEGAARGDPARIDTLWDRQQLVGAEGPDWKAERDALVKWLDEFGLRALRQRCTAIYLSSRDRLEIRLFDYEGGYQIVADPRASGGYLYIGACALFLDDVVAYEVPGVSSPEFKILRRPQKAPRKTSVQRRRKV